MTRRRHGLLKLSRWTALVLVATLGLTAVQTVAPSLQSAGRSVGETPEMPESGKREPTYVAYRKDQERRKTQQLEKRKKRFDEERQKHEAFWRDVAIDAPYWRIGNGFESTLIVNNTLTRSIEFTPEVYSEHGRRIDAKVFTVAGLGSETIPLRNLIAEEGQGQITLRFHGEALEVHGSIIISNAAQSLSVDHSFLKRGGFSSSRLSGVFYAPSPTADVHVAVSNMSERVIGIGFAVQSENQETPEGRIAGPSSTVGLGPHETRVINLRPFFQNLSPGAAAGGILLSHTGVPGDLLVHGMVNDINGFSANMRFLESESLAKLDLTSPVYQANELKPIVFLSNTTGESATVGVTARYNYNGQRHEAALRTATVGPHNAARIDLAAQIAQLIPKDATQVALKITRPDGKGGLLADSLLVDSTGSGVMQLFPKGYAGEVHPSHGFPFRIGGSMDTMVTVANPSEEEIEYSLHLFYEGGTYTHTDTRLLPGEVKHIDIGDLQHRQIPGQRKALIPLTVSSGQGKVHFRPKGPGQKSQASSADHAGHTGHHGGTGQGGVAGATIFDSTTKTSFATICEPICVLWGVYIYASMEAEVGNATHLQACSWLR